MCPVVLYLSMLLLHSLCQINLYFHPPLILSDYCFCHLRFLFSLDSADAAFLPTSAWLSYIHYFSIARRSMLVHQQSPKLPVPKLSDKDLLCRCTVAILVYTSSVWFYHPRSLLPTIKMDCVTGISNCLLLLSVFLSWTWIY